MRLPLDGQFVSKTNNKGNKDLHYGFLSFCHKATATSQVLTGIKG